MSNSSKNFDREHTRENKTIPIQKNISRCQSRFRYCFSGPVDVCDCLRHADGWYSMQLNRIYSSSN